MIGIGTSGLSREQVFKLKQDNELIKESIYNILTTNKGERAGNPAFGTDLNRLLFNPNLETYWEAVKLEIIKDIELWEPRVVVLTVEFMADQENNKLTLYVFFINIINQELDVLAIKDLTQ
jgi:phage baseplate assembly protein W